MTRRAASCIPLSLCRRLFLPSCCPRHARHFSSTYDGILNLFDSVEPKLLKGAVEDVLAEKDRFLAEKDRSLADKDRFLDRSLADKDRLYGMVVAAKENEVAAKENELAAKDQIIKRALADLARARLLIANRILVEDGLKAFAPNKSTREAFKTFRDKYLICNGNLTDDVMAVITEIAPRNAAKLQRDVVSELRDSFIHDVSKALHYEVLASTEWKGWACGGHGIVGPTVAAVLNMMQRQRLVPHHVVYVDETMQPFKVLTSTGSVADLEDFK